MSIPSSYPIEACAAIIVGAESNGDPLPGAVEWVRRRLISGEFSGYKAARRWRMTDSDIAAAIESLRPQHAQTANAIDRAEPDAPLLLTSMTKRSRSRLAAL